MQTVDLIINARYLVPITTPQAVLEHYAVIIKDSHIVALLPQDEASKKYTATSTYHLPHHCLIPGLINNHTHTPMNLFRGFADDLPLMTWLNEHIWPLEKQHVNEQFVEAGSRLAIAEMIKGGSTCFNDSYFFPDATARVAEQSGIRASLGIPVINVPTQWASNTAEYLQKGLQLHDQYRLHPRITTTYAPHAPYTVDNATLTTIASQAEEMDIPIHMHIHESVAETAQSMEEFGMRPLERLKDLGLLTPRLMAVHMTQLNSDEINWCAESGVNIVHCPESNLKLASGFCPVAELDKHGINISIGTDGAASNNDLDMFGEIRQAALLAKAVGRDASAIPAYKALEMATINAAKALGLDDKIGSITAGKQADLTAIDLSGLESQPLYNIVSQLVYATSRHQVTDVWVAGQQLLKQGQLTQLDEAEIIADTQQWVNKIGNKTL